MLQHPSMAVTELRHYNHLHDMLSASIPVPPAAIPAQPASLAASHAPKMPPPALPPQLSFELDCLDVPPPAPVHLPQQFDTVAGSLLAQQLLQQVAAQGQAMHKVKVKNTFIDSCMPRSTSLEHLRQTQSCPGSRLPSPLPTPTRKTTSTGFSARSSPKKFDMTPSTCDIAVAKLVEKIHGDRYECGMPQRPSLQAAAWQAYNQQRPPLQGLSRYAQELPLSKPRSQVVQLDSLLGFNVSDPSSTPVIPAAGVARKVSVPRIPDTSVSQLPRLGSAELPSVGSLGHHINRCKPCAFVGKTGCSNGVQCNFCHMCAPGEKKRRRKEKRSLLGAARSLQFEEEL